MQRKAGPGVAQLRHVLNGLGDQVGRVGVFETSKYEDGTPVAYVAAIQEFGAAQQGIPPRSFMRSTSETQRGAWAETARKGAKAVVKGSVTGPQVLDIIGQQAAGDIRRTISKITTPALKPATVANRLRKRADKQTVGSLTKPLVDSGILLNSITNTVGPK